MITTLNDASPAAKPVRPAAEAAAPVAADDPVVAAAAAVVAASAAAAAEDPAETVRCSTLFALPVARTPKSRSVRAATEMFSARIASVASVVAVVAAAVAAAATAGNLSLRTKSDLAFRT